MKHPKELSILDYTYDLPKEKIALYPLPERDQSKLLIWKAGNIQSDIYKKIACHLPENAILVLNNTRVIPARILFTKDTGSTIEIFCLEPVRTTDYSDSFSGTRSTTWKCMVGGISKWKSALLEKKVFKNQEQFLLTAKIVETQHDGYLIEFSWEPGDISFREVLAMAGEIPLPPYIKRKATADDKERYQSIFAKETGSVAAPTASLHFTDAIFNSLIEINTRIEYITLHVGAGTFMPVKSNIMHAHEMHAEWIEVNTTTILALMNNAHRPVIAVGTTSVRTLESLYWMGVKAILNPGIEIAQLAIRQWEVYDQFPEAEKISKVEALSALLVLLKNNDLTKILIQTQILIAPGYTFRIVDILVTNFHQPQSTLLLLVAAAIGAGWKDLYEFALKENFRFLSYGDGCLLYVTKQERLFISKS